MPRRPVAIDTPADAEGRVALILIAGASELDGAGTEPLLGAGYGPVGAALAAKAAERSAPEIEIDSDVAAADVAPDATMAPEEASADSPAARTVWPAPMARALGGRLGSRWATVVLLALALIVIFLVGVRLTR